MASYCLRDDGEDAKVRQGWRLPRQLNSSWPFERKKNRNSEQGIVLAAPVLFSRDFRASASRKQAERSLEADS